MVYTIGLIRLNTIGLEGYKTIDQQSPTITKKWEFQTWQKLVLNITLWKHESFKHDEN